MAEPKRASKLYDHETSGKSSASTIKKELTAKPATKPETITTGIASTHKGQRDEMQRRHEVERREQTSSQRDEERQMNARHEGEYAAMGGKDG